MDEEEKLKQEEEQEKQKEEMEKKKKEHVQTTSSCIHKMILYFNFLFRILF